MSKRGIKEWIIRSLILVIGLIIAHFGARLREKWSRENQTVGQCSITAFLAQDIFGGKVYGILRQGGNYHCYNVVGDYVFDLTSEQFGDEKLCYENNPEQFRETHWQKTEKHERYNYLKAELLKKLEEL